MFLAVTMVLIDYQKQSIAFSSKTTKTEMIDWKTHRHTDKRTFEETDQIDKDKLLC
jgi:hypothetical protein